MIKCFCIPIGTKILIILIAFFVLLHLILIFFLYRSQEYFPAKNITNKNPESVVLLHGIGKSNRITYLMAKRLSNAGFEVYNITYPYKKHTIQELSDFLNDKIIELGINKKSNVNFVGHSMGGLIIRAYINKYKPKNLHRVVMVGTPNHGSELADSFKDWTIYKIKFGSVSGKQIGTNLEGLDKAFGPVNYDLGIIAGKTWSSPIFSRILPGDDDGIVTIKSTKLKGMHDHIIMNFSHTPGIQYKKVANMVISYLKNGKFDRNLKL